MMVGRAHPRSRGENRDRRGEPVNQGGSSPLTRGKLRVRADQPGKRRLIPAHAGKTLATGRRRSRLGAHPRSRGEN